VHLLPVSFIQSVLQLHWHAQAPAHQLAARVFTTDTVFHMCFVLQHTLLQAFVALEATPLQFNGLNLRNVLDAPAAVTHFVFANYTADTLLRSPAVLGSLMAIGNPTALVNEWCKGLHDLIIVPLWAIPQVSVAAHCIDLVCLQ
jgi:Vacuolar-sorting-associated 13 protein C-terminal